MKFLASVALSFLLAVSSVSAQTSTDYRLNDLSGVDTYIRSSTPNNSFGFDQNLVTGGWGDWYATMIKFNVSGLPAITTGDKVSLWLYNKSPGGYAQPTAVNIGLLATDFNNYTTYNNSGLSWYTSTVAQVNVGAYGYWTEFDITSYYNYWKSGVANYGIALTPLNTNNYFNFFQSTETSDTSVRPLLRITKASQKTYLQWPLSTPYSSRVVTQAFGVDWSTGTRCPADTGPIKKHNGTDYRASAGVQVYAASSGYVKSIPQQAPYGSGVVVEHVKTDGTKFTTVYWHIDPTVTVGDFVSAGQKIGVIANISTGSHLHFGIRNGAYTSNSSGTGALPVSDCGGYPSFPNGFLDPENNSLFQIQ